MRKNINELKETDEKTIHFFAPVAPEFRGTFLNDSLLIKVAQIKKTTLAFSVGKSKNFQIFLGADFQKIAKILSTFF